ncbi:glycoside hydrolase family 92 protein [Amniculicola lignicola CBS 123094]|uniref:Glycoside hydrolase family 92 protein n=1 Tax=Amniculicola lignicola CBS 123094 TaxID=1392246 RepID=A0A6A5WSZ1_9PLEO|nr:glycoside hydrolase family 92 protein [Amniculicola lignicola CBS 123094]
MLNLLDGLYSLSDRAANFDVLDWIDPLIGSNGGGNVFAGATLPYGLAKVSADGSRVTGFSAMHDSGTGGNPSLGNFPIFPQLYPGNDLNGCKFPIGVRAMNYKKDSIKATPGYLGIILENGNDASTNPPILLDLTHLWASRQNGRMQGSGIFLPSFGAGSYVLHYCLDIAGATIADSGVWVNDRAGTEPKELYITRNAEKEIPGPGFDFDFDRLVHFAREAWKKKVAPISIDFWSAIYRTTISPQDYTDENPDWNSDEPYFDSFYCLWDMWRVQPPFLTITDPLTQSRIVQSLLDIYKHRGWLPDCIDWNLPYDAENELLEWGIEGRSGLTSWKRFKYIPYLDFNPRGFGTSSCSISRTLECAYNDFSLATLAKGLGKDTYTKYLSRAGNWQKLFKSDQKSIIIGSDSSFTDFFQPKYLNAAGNICSLFPMIFVRLISLLGGPDTFLRQLDFFHTSELADIGNEPVFLTVYMPHYAGPPGLSAKRVYDCIPSHFNSSQNSLPGNDGSGAMVSFLPFACTGLFPNPGWNVYFIIPPFFEAEYRRIHIHNTTLNGARYERNWIGHEFLTEGWMLELWLGEEGSD